MSRPHPRRGSGRLSAQSRELGAVTPLELYFDLVFVLGFTQCTALMAAEPTWVGIGRGMLVLAALWWAWVGFAWLTSVIDPEEGVVRIAMFSAMAALLVVGLCVPESFGARAVAFAVGYAVVRGAHLGLFLVASRDDPALRRSVLGFAISSATAVSLLISASLVDNGARTLLWLCALVVDWVGPLGYGLAGWRLTPDHFAERHNLVIILALGESIIAIGIAAQVDLTASVVIAAVLGVALASALWWIYFDVVSLVTEQRLARATEGRDRRDRSHGPHGPGA